MQGFKLIKERIKPINIFKLPKRDSMNFVLKSLVILFCSVLFIQPVNAQKKYKIRKVAIDAGHGGKDPGAIGFISQEKEINLKIALRLGKMLQDSTGGAIQPIYTRTSDWYPTLKERHAIANNAKADLFISIHINSTAPRKEVIKTGTKKQKYYVGKGKKRKARYKTVPVYKTIYHKETATKGTETYVLGLHRMDQKEEAIINYEDDKNFELMDMNDPTTKIIINQYSQRYLAKSVSLASKIQSNFRLQGRNDLGVKQKGLEVLAGSAMPGVLVEFGFINNREEEAYLNSSKGIEECAYSIYKAIIQYATIH